MTKGQIDFTRDCYQIFFLGVDEGEQISRFTMKPVWKHTGEEGSEIDAFLSQHRRKIW